MRKTKSLVAVAAALCLLIALLVVPVLVVNGSDEGHGGLTVGGAVEEDVYTGKDSPYATDNYSMTKDLSVMPVTVEAWVYISEAISGSDVGTFYGNFWSKNNYGTACLNYEILEGAIPRLYWSDSIASVYDIKFESSPLPTDEWAHLTLIYDGKSGVVSCYINGELTEEKYYYPEIEADALAVPMSIGGNSGNMNPDYFKGEIGDITVYSDVRSVSEIGSDFAKGMQMTKATADLSDAICYYDIDSDDMGKDITDDTGNGNDMLYSKTWLTETEMEEIRKSYGFTPAYSFAVIGDTQTTTDYYPNQLPTLYQWIVDNAAKDKRNIVFSIGLGDITNDNGRTRRYTKDSNGNYVMNSNGTYTHWDIAYDAITLLDGNVPYSLIRGNHDVYPDLTTGVRLEGFNTYFEKSAYFTSQFTKTNGGGRYGDGQYDEVNSVKDLVTGYANSYANTFQTLTVGQNKYLFVNIDWKITDSIINWADKVISAHSDHRVIINTHSYMNGDGTTIDDGDPTPNSSYNGDELWNVLVSKHSNVEMVLSGHISNDRIVVTQVKGDNGNTVTEMLINPQGYDALLGGCSMVAMFYFDETGDKLAMEWYSTTKDRYFKTTSNYVIDLSDNSTDTSVRVDPVWDGVSYTEPEGSGTEADPYLIANAENLVWIGKNITEGDVSFAGKYFKQTADIDLDGKSMTSIGTYYLNSHDMAAFGGIYDGCGNSIKNGTVTTAASRQFVWSEGYGLFGVIYGATIKNVVLDNVQIIGRGVTGGIVGRAAAPTVTDTTFEGFNEIIGCEIKDTVNIVTLTSDGSYVAPTSYDDAYRAGRVGSVCGMAYSTLIKGCNSAAKLEAYGDFGLVGGIAGTAGLNCTIDTCSFTGCITLKDKNASVASYLGGIVGAISPSANTKGFSGEALGVAGGLVINSCYNSTSLVCSGGESISNVYGGIIGFFGATQDVGDNSIEKPYFVKNCYYIEGYKAVAGGTGYVIEDSLALSISDISSYVTTIDSEIASIKNSTYQPIWVIGLVEPTATGIEGLKYFNAASNVYYIYTNGAWEAVKNINISETTLETEYGAIPKDYITSPIILFVYSKSEGAYSCVGGYDTLTAVVDAIASNMSSPADKDSKCVAYFRADVTSTKAVSGNLGYSVGTVIFDLAGHTLTQASAEPLFRSYSKYAAGDVVNYPNAYYLPAYYTIKNGDIVLDSHGLFYFGMDGSAYNNYTGPDPYEVKSLYWTLDGVDISLAEGATLTSIIGEYKEHTDLKVKKATHTSLAINDNCTIDISNAKNKVTIFDACDPITDGMQSNGTSYYTNSIVNVSVGACEIKAANSNFVWHKVADNGSSVIYTKNSTANFVKVTVPNTVSLDTATVFTDENGNKYGLEKSSTNEVLGTVTYTIGELDTPYGNVSDSYKSYPILVFVANDDGTYTIKGGYTTLTSAFSEAQKHCKTLPNKVVVYFQDSVENSSAVTGNIGYNVGTMIFDLGGNTLTQAGGVPMFKAHTKYEGSYATSYPNYWYLPGNFEIKNGNIVLTDYSLFSVGMEGGGYNSYTPDESTGHKFKTLYWTLDNVDVALATGSTVSSLFVTLQDNSALKNGNKSMFFDLVIKDNCTFDISNATEKVTLFNANDDTTSGLVSGGTYYCTDSIINITVDGCEIIANDASFEWTSVNTSNGSSVTFTDKENLKITLASGTYSLSDFDTPYGTIAVDSSYANNAILLFLKNADGSYTLKKGYDEFATALADTGNSFAYKDENATWVIYLRKDISNTSGSTGNIGFSIGTVIIDLGGHTLTQGGGVPLIRAHAKFKTGYYQEGNFELINGNIVLNDAGIFHIGTEGSGYRDNTNVKTINWTLDGVNISLAEGATVTNIICEYRDRTDLTTANKDMIFNLTVKENCTIDISNATKSVTLFNANDKRITGTGTYEKSDGSTVTYYHVNAISHIVVESCKITANDTNFNWSEINESNGSSVVLVNEKTIKVTLPGGTYTYDQIHTPYGNVESEWLGKTFVVFKYENGVYTNVYADNSIAQALAADKVGARMYCANEGDTAVVYMISDATSVAISGNLCLLNGTMIIDLGGHKLTQGAAEPIFRSYAKCGAHSSTNTGEGIEHTATFKIINGEIILNSYGLFRVGMEGSNNYAKSKCIKTVDWTLDNVDISLSGGATLTTLIEYKDNSGATSDVRDMYFNLTVKENCTIDISNATKTVTLFNAKDNKISGNSSGNYATNSIVNITVEGCKIISDSIDFVWTAIQSNGSSVIFDKTSDGNYMYLVLSKAAAEEFDTSKVFETSDGTKLVLVKIFEDESTVTYRLRPVEVSNIDFTPKISITLDRELIMNIYIPTELLLKFTLDGVEYANLANLAESERVIDGKTYYLVRIELPAAEAARAVKLVATVSIGEKIATGTFTFSIPTYAQKVITTGNEIETTLVRDVLSYVRSAYVYFGKQDKAAIANIDTIIGENYDAENTPELNGSAETPTVGLKSATLVLGATPAIRFYISGSPDSYEFYVNGVKLNTVTVTDGDGKTYVEMDVYAYAMCDTVTYCIDGVESGSYHINSYYEYAKTLNDSELVNLVERFAKYCESAKAYKASATN